MENRPSVHYPGNTVADVPHPGKKRRAKYMDTPNGVVYFEGKNMGDRSDKVCAVTVCVWCNHNAGQYFITCGRCRNCQYCGMVDNVDPYRCYLCGNYLPDELKPEVVKYHIEPKRQQGV